jgi:hypothetical protein
MDLNINVLPLKVTASLVMDSTDQNALLFPVSEMILDDLHFAMACTENMVSNIKKRGLEQISEMLESSFEKQKLSDRTNQYILEKVLKEHTNVGYLVSMMFLFNSSFIEHDKVISI